jgi:cation diffusion facilitator CzcD-associated flavoprotein CzcO
MFRTIIIGAGFSGIGAAIKLLEEGERDFIVLDRGTDVGGTWRDNTYPGCRCDIPSHLYSFSFAPNPDWSETFSPQPEIWAYLRRTASERGVTPHVRGGHELIDATWDDADAVWTVTTSGGSFTSRYLILAIGALVEPSMPDIPGLEAFTGKVMHSARWDGGYDLTGKRVAVVGTGASAIQIVPNIQPVVSHLDVFQRTPAWIVPHPGRPVRPWERRLYRALPWAQRLVRAKEYAEHELTALAFVKYPQLMKGGRRLALRHLESQVADPSLRRKLTPHYEMGCKRVLPSNDFYPALTKANVDLITSPIVSATPAGLVTADGAEHRLDTIVFGTGFHVTDNPTARLVHGREGHRLSEVFEASTATLGAYLGTTVPYFPNMFMMTGPNTGLGHNSMVYMIESQLQYVMDAFRKLRRTAMDVFEVRPEVAEAYNADLQAALPGTVWASGCKSWYLDASGRNITLWPRFTFQYRARTRRFALGDYLLRRAPVRRREVAKG